MLLLCVKIYILINQHSIKLNEIKLLCNISIISMNLMAQNSIFFVLEIQFVIRFEAPRKVSCSRRSWTNVPLLESSEKHFVDRYRLCLEKKFRRITACQDISILSRMISPIHPIRIRKMNAIAVRRRLV